MRRIILLAVVTAVVALVVAMSASSAMATKFPPGANCGHNSKGFVTFSESPTNFNFKVHDCKAGTPG